MKHKIFSIYDEKAQAYFPPFFMPKKGMAMREFMNLVIDKNSSISQHPYDYTLFYLGIFDDLNGALLYKDKKECLGNGLEFKNNEVSGIEQPTPMEKILQPNLQEIVDNSPDRPVKTSSTSSPATDKPISDAET